MKLKAKYYILNALFLCFILPEARVVHAQTPADKDSILDFMPAITAGAFSKFSADNTEECKLVFKSLYCGDGKGGVVDNYYIIFINENKTPTKGPAEYGFDEFDPLNEKHCSADLIEYTQIGYTSLPKELQNSLIIPIEMKAVYHRVRVHNGNGSIPNIDITQKCLK